MEDRLSGQGRWLLRALGHGGEAVDRSLQRRGAAGDVALGGVLVVARVGLVLLSGSSSEGAMRRRARTLSDCNLGERLWTAQNLRVNISARRIEKLLGRTHKSFLDFEIVTILGAKVALLNDLGLALRAGNFRERHTGNGRLNDRIHDACERR